jgi:hypothetical protein
VKGNVQRIITETRLPESMRWLRTQFAGVTSTEGLAMKALLLIVIVILAAGFATDAAAQSAEDLFQQALRVERVSGNTEAAIDLYAQVVMDYPTERAVVARALLQMGKAYEVLGQGGAREAYSRIVAEYADFDTVADEAAERIAAFARLDVPSSPSPEPGSLEMITLAPSLPGGSHNLWGAGMSPDGEWVVRAADTGVVVQHLKSGAVDSLAVLREICGSTRSARFSPSGNQIALSCYPQEQEKDGRWGVVVFDRGSRTAELVFDGGEYFGAGDSWFHVLNWSADGSAVLVRVSFWGESIPDVYQMLLVPTSGGTPATIETHFYEAGYTDQACLLRDDRYMFGLYGWRPGSIHRTDTRTGERVPVLFDDLAEMDLYDCLPDSNMLIYGSSPTNGPSSLFSATVGPDGTLSEPRFLASLPQRSIPLPGARNGNVYYGDPAPDNFIAVADVDTLRGRAISNLRRIDARNQMIPTIRWSPTGNHFVVTSRWTATIAGFNGFEGAVWNLPVFEEGEGDTELNKWLGLMIWSPDGTQLISSHPTTTNSFHYQGTEVYDRDTGELRHQTPDLAAVAWLPDASGFYYVDQDESRRCLSTFTFSNRETREVFCLEGPPMAPLPLKTWRWSLSPGWSLSPDGATFVYWGREGELEAEERPIFLLDTETWTMKQIGVSEIKNRTPQISWASDSSRFFSYTQSERGLRAYDLTTGVWTPWSLSGMGDQRALSVAVHPSGTRIAMHAGGPPMTGLHLSIIHQPSGLVEAK